MKNYNKHNGFTLAEVLITLAIMGTIAAILFPSILANYNERTLKAKRQALFGRMSQAMGEMANTFRNYEDVDCVNNNDATTCTDLGSAAKFVNEGFSKVYKIAAVCDNDSLAACDIPDEIKREDGTPFSLKDKGQSISKFNPQITLHSSDLPYDTDSIGLMTKNGESILLFYNPNCQGKTNPANYNLSTGSMLCVNMIYDLNGGRQKPNKIGEDIGYISVFYSDSPYVVSPKPYSWKGVPDYDTTTDATGNEVKISSMNQNQETARQNCEALGENVGLPTREEGMAMQVNRELWAPLADQVPPESANTGGYFWTSTILKPGYAWVIWMENSGSTTHNLYHIARTTGTTDSTFARCVYKD